MMTMNTNRPLVSIRQFGKWLKAQWIAEVPEELALCEFDCRKNQCASAEWAACQRRISKATGELIPAARAIDRSQKSEAAP